MEPHRLAEERSLAYHRAVAERLAQEPELLDRARRRVGEWMENEEPAAAWARRWAEVLAVSTAQISAFLRELSHLADELRQSSPFAGALGARERWRIWRETRARVGSRP
jgi:hypothetical protein